MSAAAQLSARRAAVNAAYRADEAACVTACLAAARLAPEVTEQVRVLARRLVEGVRESAPSAGLEAFLKRYDLASEEGVLLLCLAEALLRVPDAETADRLIRDKIGGHHWERQLGASEGVLVNASIWALMLSGRLLGPAEVAGGASWQRGLKALVRRTGAPLVRTALLQGIRILAHQFVLGRTIEEALGRAAEQTGQGYRHSFDMLGEAAHTAADAARYVASYEAAITAAGAASAGRGPIEGPGISIKLSALHPRYEYAQAARVQGELLPRLRALAERARDAGIGLTIDAEEADRLDLSLDLLAELMAAPSLKDWDGLGVAVQAYQKRALPLIDWLAALTEANHRRLIVRLVKGAYWDSEIKRAQVLGIDGYPVFTRKGSTDVSYLACAHRLFAAPKTFYPAIATHNAHTLASVLVLAGARRDFELQRLHGMGEALYAQTIEGEPLAARCRIYAPVGSHEDLLPYLVRRLLENGANTSFVNRIADADLPVDAVIADPVASVAALDSVPHPKLPLPEALYGAARRNARGIDLSDGAVRAELLEAVAKALKEPRTALPIIDGVGIERALKARRNPADRRQIIGEAAMASQADATRAFDGAARAQSEWDGRGAAARAACLEAVAEQFEAHTARLLALLIVEAGKTLPDALAELREAVDYLRYYAALARDEFAVPRALKGPTGERNELGWRGRGVFLCISPWNFPLAIFVGQIAAALVAGNAVLAKPAEQTPMIAAEAVRLMLGAGIPSGVLQLLPGDGPRLGGVLLKRPALAGVAFTGSTEAAWQIARALAARDAPIAPLIAETGGQNAMLVDSSALAEQVVRDVLTSAFQSAGQRCSALRVLFLQKEIAPRVLDLLAGAMTELKLGDPLDLATDIGPIIDDEARQKLLHHAEWMRRDGRIIQELALPASCRHGSFFAPLAVEIDNIALLKAEVFGPILHIVRYAADRLDQVIAAINATGYGLTLGLHSRIESTVARVRAGARVGNLYVNRGQIGAVVGVQPFGGEGLSGSGPKAGGPHYLFRFATERTVSIDLTAAGGNATLLSLDSA
jgi:RHH-type proline utilization regulon transcriptional repressor/proline dehydrogenase/delta 1-pyrroline-5-carboxylate dehydrogenase